MAAEMPKRLEIFKKVRDEQDTLRPNNEPLTYEILEQCVYTRAVVREILRWRPPAVMVI